MKGHTPIKYRELGANKMVALSVCLSVAGGTYLVE